MYFLSLIEYIPTAMYWPSYLNTSSIDTFDVKGHVSFTTETPNPP